MIGLAAERKRNNGHNALVVVSPIEGFEFEISEDLLNVNMINLGDFCEIKVKNNTPESFSLKTPKEFRDLKVELDEEAGTAKISGVVGVLISNLALFYQTKEFGDIPCKDEHQGIVGKKYNLLISRLPENQRIGMYSKYVWQGFSDGEHFESSSEDRDSVEVTSVDDEEEENEEDEDQEIEDTKVSDEEKNVGGDTSDVAAFEVLPKLITGFVTGRNPKFDISYVACNLTYPGVDGFVYCSKNRRLNVGDWVEVRFTEADFAKYFPAKPTFDTPRFTFTFFKKIKKPANYSVHMTDKGPEVRIKSFELTASHRTGNDIEDRFLGTISDGQSYVSGRHKLVDLVIRRRKPFKTKNKTFTTWFVKSSKKAVIRSESTDRERSSSAESRARSQKAPVKKSKSNHEPLQNKNGGKESATHQTNSSPIGMLGYLPLNWNMMPSYNAAIRTVQGSLTPNPQYFIPGCVSQLPPQFGTGVVDRKLHKKRFDKQSEDEENLVLKRAVVTSVKSNRIKKNGKDSSAYLWLLDDHVPSIYYFSSRDKEIFVGLFFQGAFLDIGNKWECKKYIKSLDALMSVIGKSNPIEIQATVYKYFPRSAERLNAETFHRFLGKIIDKYDHLPADCSSGVKICIKLKRLDERDEYCWIVHRQIQSKHIQLITEFHNAWHKDGVRKTIELRCPVQFRELRGLLDTAAEGQMTHAHNQWKKLDKDSNPENGKDVAFAWVTVQDGDFIRMVVFPRVEGQKMSEMKKHVTDRKIYQKVERMEVQKLYSVKLNESSEVMEMFDCPQYFSAKSNGEIEFKLVSRDKTLLARNVGLVEPIGMPKWVGKLMFCPEQPISNKTVLMKAGFRLLNDRDLFVDDELVSSQGVCFMSIGSVEKLPNQDLDIAVQEDQIDQKENRQGQTVFQTRLECQSPATVYNKFQEVCRVLDDSEVIEAMKKQSVDVIRLIRLKSTSL